VIAGVLLQVLPTSKASVKIVTFIHYKVTGCFTHGNLKLEANSKGESAQVMLLVTASYLLARAAPQNQDKMHCGIDVSRKPQLLPMLTMLALS